MVLTKTRALTLGALIGAPTGCPLGREGLPPIAQYYGVTVLAPTEVPRAPLPLRAWPSHGIRNAAFNPGKIGRGTVRPFAIEPLDDLHVHRNEAIQIAASPQDLIGVPVPRAMRDQVRRDSALGERPFGESGVVVKALVQRAESELLGLPPCRGLREQNHGADPPRRGAGLHGRRNQFFGLGHGLRVLARQAH